MLRPVLFAAAAMALVAPARAAEPDLAGKWLFTTLNMSGEQVVCILKIESKDGKPSATVEFSPQNVESSVALFSATDKGVTATIRQVRTAQGRSFTSNLEFTGIRGKDPKQILGSIKGARAKLVATDKTELAANELFVPTTVEPITKALELLRRPNQLLVQASRETDADKKKELQQQAADARKESTEKTPALYREVVQKHPESPVALDAALNLIQAAGRLKMDAAEASKIVALIRSQSEAYGDQWVFATLLPPAETLLEIKGLESAAFAAIEPVAKLLTDAQPTDMQSRVLAAYASALTKVGKMSEAKEVAARYTRLEEKIDAEYKNTVPPFKPVAFAGRKDTSANQVVVMELFTGAQCPPCVAADVAFDALEKSYKHSELVLIQYHLHIPGPDPLTNAETVARAKYYAANSTPTTLFNGKKLAGGGGGMANAEVKFKQYTGIIDPLLEKTSEVKVTGKADRSGDKVNIAVEVAGVEGDDTKLRLLVVEETIKYVGGNNLRFHHQVVRAMPGGADGVAVKDKTFKHSASVDLVNVRKELTAYLDEFAKERPFPKPQRPMDMKSLRVIALVQNDKTKEIVQALQIDLDNGSAASSGGE